jgi:hypothetical protein
MEDIEHLLGVAESQAGRGLFSVLKKTLQEIEARLDGQQMPERLESRWRYLHMCWRPVKSSIQSIEAIRTRISEGKLSEAENLIKCVRSSPVNMSLRYKGQAIGHILNEVEQDLQRKKRDAKINQTPVDIGQW